MLRCRIHGFAIAVLAGAAVQLSTPSVDAQVQEATPDSFTLARQASVNSDPEAVWSALIEPARWWHPDHTFSGDSANLRLDASPGGCFCEDLANGGGVMHLEVVHVAPGAVLRLIGGLGPLQDLAVSGTLTWTLQAAESGTEIRVVYRVAGRAPGGLEAWAGPVDGVILQQLERLARYLETGSPE